MHRQRPSLVQERQTHRQIATELCGFITIVAGTCLLHATRDLDINVQNLSQLANPTPLNPTQEVPEFTRLQNVSAGEHQMRRSLPSRGSESTSEWV